MQAVIAHRVQVYEELYKTDSFDKAFHEGIKGEQVRHCTVYVEARLHFDDPIATCAAH